VITVLWVSCVAIGSVLAVRWVVRQPWRRYWHLFLIALFEER
jgi:hypothetical protein